MIICLRRLILLIKKRLLMKQLLGRKLLMGVMVKLLMVHLQLKGKWKKLNKLFICSGYYLFINI